MLPPANPTFAGRPMADQAKPLAQAFVPEKAPGLSRTQKSLVAVPLVAVTALLAVFAGGFGLRTYRAHERAKEIQQTSVAFPASIAGLTKRASAQAQVDQADRAGADADAAPRCGLRRRQVPARAWSSPVPTP